MLTYIIIGIVILIIGIILSIIPGHKPNSELNKITEVRTSSVDILLAEIRAQESIEAVIESNESELGSGIYEEYEVTGVHIAHCKNYILKYCEEYDELELMHEKYNKYSEKAISVKHDGEKIGYIREYDVDEVYEIIMNPYTSHIAKIEYDGLYLTVHLALRY